LSCHSRGACDEALCAGMGGNERKLLTDSCPEFTEISKGIRLYLIAPLGPQIWKLIK